LDERFAVFKEQLIQEMKSLNKSNSTFNETDKTGDGDLRISVPRIAMDLPPSRF